MQKGFFQMERYNTTVYHLIFLDFWCIMHPYQIRETRFFGGQFNVSRLHLTPKFTPTYACLNSR